MLWSRSVAYFAKTLLFIMWMVIGSARAGGISGDPVNGGLAAADLEAAYTRLVPLPAR